MAHIVKNVVTNGVYWVNIPAADLRILCACPGDAVKHLTKRGFIGRREEKGVTYETGPNAILLSDVAVQNGCFSNLAEFPVLQMLYRQGMIIPGHPGNTGAKPLLIGHRDQVNAQMQYIYRGNYGLISEEEMREAGVGEEEAHAMMRMKLKFAFGKISHPSELLDICHVGHDQHEIRNGVKVKRLALNVFEFSYEGEKVKVDLNLEPFEKYPSPYPLGMFQVEREYFAVVHSGQGDGWDVNRPSMGSILMYQGKIYLIDVGANLEYTLTCLGISVGEVEGVFHTHCHDDHFAGLTTIIRSDHRIKYFATPLVRASVTKKLSALLSMEESSFGHFFEICDLEPSEWNVIDGLEVKPLFSPHPVETTVLQFRALWRDGYRTYAHYADIASFTVLEGMLTTDKTAPGVSRKMLNSVKSDYLEPADLKKIDIGGGMIHGDAHDFKGDQSDKIILSHTARELSAEEKEIGSGAPFGTVDILIPGNHEFVFSHAFKILRGYFPTLPLDQLRMLLNTEMVVFNPETILLKEGQEITDIYVILTGSVEMINAQSGIHSVMSAGAFVGELNGMHGIFATETYRAASFIKALRLPVDFYVTLVKKNDLFDNISKLQENREFLERTWLFGEAISDRVKNRLAGVMSIETVATGETISDRHYMGLTMIWSGSAHHLIGDTVIEALFVGDFIGEELALFETPSVLKVVAIEPCTICRIPNSAVSEIPVVLWKLFETFKRRASLLEDFDRIVVDIMQWRPEYSVNIQVIDGHHKRLVEMTSTLLQGLKNGASKEDLDEALDFLIDYTDYHFVEEEKLFRRYGYPEADDHHGQHEALLARVVALKDKMGVKGEEPKVVKFLKDWIINHILAEDRKYAAFLNEKGVY